VDALGATEAAGVVLAVAGVALGDGFVLVAGAFASLRCGASFFAAGVVVAAGFSVFVSGATDGADFGAFFSGFVTAGASLAAGSFTAGAFSAGSFAAGSFAAGSFLSPPFTTGTSVFGACVGAAGSFFSGFLPGACDSSGVGCWAITAPASASEATISKLVNFFMLILSWS
jgi:hypothetical protein